jgi:hypothetical protein
VHFFVWRRYKFSISSFQKRSGNNAGKLAHYLRTTQILFLSC